MSAQHTCVQEVNAQLERHNTALASAFSLGRPQQELILLATVKADSKKRGKPVSMYASFCPFCGVSLKEPA